MRINKSIIYLSCLTAAVLFSCTSGSGKINELTGNLPNNATTKLSYADTNNITIKRIIDSLDLYYANEIRRGFNGSVLVANKGKIIYERYFGYANKTTGATLKPNTSTQLSSTSKPFTATAIMWLNQNKYLDINLPVNAYLPDFPYADITVKMLLCHRSGLPNYTSTKLPRWNTKGPMYNLDLQKYLAMYKPALVFKPNAAFKYCNTNYALLARIIEEVSGIPYKQFMKELIFDPLGMKNTFVYDPKDDYSNRDIAVSYRSNWTVFENNHEDGVYGDKGIFSTVEDMLRWDQSFYNNKILNNTTTRMAYTGCSWDMKGIKNYGLGWRMYDFKNGQKLVFHNGLWHGNNSVFYRFTQENTTIIVLGNKLNSKIYDQGKAVYHILNNVAPQAFKCTFDAVEEGEE